MIFISEGQTLTTQTSFGGPCDHGQLGDVSLTVKPGTSIDASFTFSDAGPLGTLTGTGSGVFGTTTVPFTAGGTFSFPAECGQAPITKNQFAATQVVPFSGMFAGKLVNGDSVILTFTETPDFALTITGTDNGSPVTLSGTAIGGAFRATGTDGGTDVSYVGVMQAGTNTFVLFDANSNFALAGEVVAGSNPNAPLPVPLTGANAGLVMRPMAVSVARKS